MSSNLHIEESGTINLPLEVRERYGLTGKTPLRIVETRGD